MRLEEIQNDAAKQRLKRMNSNAKSMKNKATQLKAQADASAEQLKLQQSRTQQSFVRKAAQTSMIKPHT